MERRGGHLARIIRRRKSSCDVGSARFRSASRSISLAPVSVGRGPLAAYCPSPVRLSREKSRRRGSLGRFRPVALARLDPRPARRHASCSCLSLGAGAFAFSSASTLITIRRWSSSIVVARSSRNFAMFDLRISPCIGIAPGHQGPMRSCAD